MPFRHSGSTISTLLLFLICFTLHLQTGCAPRLPPEPPPLAPRESALEEEARALLDRAEGQLSAKQYDQAFQTAASALEKYPSFRHRDRALFLKGEVRFIQRDYRQALGFYREIIQEFPGSSFILEARYRLGLCYFELKEFDLAIANLKDRSRITDPERLRRISEVLSAAWLAKKNHLSAIRELVSLEQTEKTEDRKAGYRERVREFVDKNLTGDELETLAAESSYPADLAQLRLAGVLIEQREYRDAIRIARRFLEKFPDHPEKTRAEMLVNDATAKLTAPRHYLGALLPQTGRLAFFGDRVLKGIQLALHNHNLQEPENRVELIVKDTEGSPEKAVAALNELAARGIVAAIGPLLTKEAEAVATGLEQAGIPVITPAASGEDVGKLSPWLFRNALTNSSQAVAAAEFALKRQAFKAVILHPDDAYGRELTRLFTQELERKAEILATVAYPTDAKDFGPYIRRVMEIDLRSRKIPIPEDADERKKLFAEYEPGFDTLYLPGYAERVGLLIPQLAFYNVTGITMIGSNNWHSRDLIERAGRHAEGAVFVDGIFPESDDPAIKAFVDAYRSAYQEEPDILSAQAYDAAAMVLSLIRQGRDTAAAVRDGLLDISDFPGVSGATTFAGTGEARKKLFLVKIADGRFALYPEERQNGALMSD